MITLTCDDFKMEQVGTTPFFNLKIPTIVNKGKDTERIDMKIDGYGMPFETCLLKVIHKRLGELDITCTATEYIDLCIKEIDKLKSSVEYILKPSKIDEEEEIEQEVVDEN